jgi:hypothetical protein
MAMLACPSISETIFGFTFLPRSSVAHVWRTIRIISGLEEVTPSSHLGTHPAAPHVNFYVIR